MGGGDAYKITEKFDEEGRSPEGDTIAGLFSREKPTLILIEELLNYVSRYRDPGMSSQLYNFLQNLTEEARICDNVVVAVFIPASELEMNPEDQADYSRFKKMLDRLGKAVIMSAEDEVSDIIGNVETVIETLTEACYFLSVEKTRYRFSLFSL
ncbi:MAG: DUF499 domain-containing protein [Nitrospirae bacterium]|nr:DUF499 domain-containing protein [Nitrospirota bacterium]